MDINADEKPAIGEVRELDTILAAKYVLWRDYGSEGWRPCAFESEDAVLKEIHTNLHSDFVVMRPVKLRLEWD